LAVADWPQVFGGAKMTTARLMLGLLPTTTVWYPNLFHCGCTPWRKILRPAPLLGWPAASTQVDDNLTILAEVRLFAGERALTNSNAATALLAGPSHNSAVSGVTRSTHTFGSSGPFHHVLSVGFQFSAALAWSRRTSARAVIDR
jgi:hypothetical protein